MSDLKHRIEATLRESFGLEDDHRWAVEHLCEMAREFAHEDIDPELSDAWSCLFEAEALLEHHKAEQFFADHFVVINVTVPPKAS